MGLSKWPFRPNSGFGEGVERGARWNLERAKARVRMKMISRTTILFLRSPKPSWALSFSTSGGSFQRPHMELGCVTLTFDLLFDWYALYTCCTLGCAINYEGGSSFAQIPRALKTKWTTCPFCSDSQLYNTAAQRNRSSSREWRNGRRLEGAEASVSLQTLVDNQGPHVFPVIESQDLKYKECTSSYFFVRTRPLL